MLLQANIFQPLIDVLAAVLKFFHNNLGVSWGLSILLLTVALRLALLPLAIRQFHSMQRLQQHMPQLKELQAKYKGNKERQQQETMKFYSENNVNPFASCVPLLIQWPFLIAMFWTLRGNLRNDICSPFQHQFRQGLIQHGMTAAKAAGQTTPCGQHGGASFLFIHDLTNSPHGVEIVILLALYILTSIGSSLIMMAPGTEKQQRYMMLALPVVFAFITIRFPAGALLYYIFFNLWMVGQQYVFKQLIGHQYRQPPGAVVVGAGAPVGGNGRSRPGLFQRLVENATPPAADGSKLSAGQQAARAGARRARSEPAANGTSNGNGAGSAERPRAKEKASSATPAGGAAKPGAAGRATPPPPPRKKKKRSGRRR
jgi:YidC/Oxa1 family membrane protein insertase